MVPLRVTIKTQFILSIGVWSGCGRANSLPWSSPDTEVSNPGLGTHLSLCAPCHSCLPDRWLSGVPPWFPHSSARLLLLWAHLQGKREEKLTQGSDHHGDAAVVQNSPRVGAGGSSSLPADRRGMLCQQRGAAAAALSPDPVLLPPGWDCWEKHPGLQPELRARELSRLCLFPSHWEVPVLGSAIRGFTTVLIQSPAKESCRFSSRHPSLN